MRGIGKWMALICAWMVSASVHAGSAGRMLTIPLDGGGTVEVEAGVLSVPESRVKASQNRVGIPWYRLPTTATEPSTPIFLLAGGPGASGLDALQRTEGRREIEFYRSIADVVLFDQRGAGHSTPKMTCPQSARYPNDQRLTPDRLREMRRQLLAECRDQWLEAGIDLSAYNTIESAADVDALRRLFGYPRISLIGGSYGSHLGLQLMRLYPETVERSVFHGIEGPDHTWDDPDDVLRTLQRIDTASQGQATSLGLGIPQGGYLGSLARTIERLDSAPEIVTVDRDGDAVKVMVDGEIIRQMARRGGAGNHDRLEKWPSMILDLERGNLELAAAAALSYRRLRLPDPMHWSMDCSSAISPARRSRIRHSAAEQLLGRLNAEYEDLCDAWPAMPVDDDYWSVPTAPIPTLLFHGTWDVSTPLENAKMVASQLKDARLVIVEGGNHGVIYNLYGRWEPMHRLMRDFLSGNPIEPPERIAMPWTLNATGNNSHD